VDRARYWLQTQPSNSFSSRFIGQLRDSRSLGERLSQEAQKHAHHAWRGCNSALLPRWGCAAAWERRGMLRDLRRLACHRTTALPRACTPSPLPGPRPWCHPACASRDAYPAQVADVRRSASSLPCPLRPGPLRASRPHRLRLQGLPRRRHWRVVPRTCPPVGRSCAAFCHCHRIHRSKRGWQQRECRRWKRWRLYDPAL